jgi:RNA polymerase sigma-70 factor (ECF subfamily)
MGELECILAQLKSWLLLTASRMSPSDFHLPIDVASSRSAAPAPSDAALVVGIAARQEWAAAAMWERFGRLIYRIAERGLGSPHEAEDMTQDVFLCLWRKVGNLRDASALRSFVVSVTIRTLKWWLRRRRTRQSTHLTETGALPEARGRGVDLDQALSRFYRLLDKLRVDDRIAFVLRRVDGMELKEVAQSIGCSLATVKRRLCRADADLLRLMEGEPVLVTFLHGEGRER